MRWLLPLLAGCSAADAGSFLTEDVVAAASGSTVTLDAYASTPGSPSAGDLLVSTDGPYWRIYDGAAWDDYLPGSDGPITAPPSTGWTALSGALTSVEGGTLEVTGVGAGATDSIYRTAPATPYTVQVGIHYAMGTSARVGFHRASVDDAVVLLGDSRVVHYQSWSTNWTTSLTLLQASTFLYDAPQGGVLWVQMEDDGVDLYLRTGMGPSGPWDEVWTAARTAHIAGGPTEITVGVSDYTIALVHYEES